MDALLSPPEVLGPLGPILVPFILGFATVLLALWYSSQKQTYWKKIGIPYVKPLPWIGSVWENSIKPLQDVELDRHKKFGKIYGHYEGNRPLLSVADPDLLRGILVKDFQAFTGRRRFDFGGSVARKMLSNLQGEDWKRVRSIITPTFTTGKIKRMLSIFKDCSETLVKNFRMAAELGKPVEVKRLYGAFTMDIIASTAFSTKIDSHNDPSNPFVQTARSVFVRNVNWRFILFTLAPGLMKLFRISIFSPGGVEFFKKATLQIIEERKRTGKRRNDFLQLLMDTAKEVDDEGKQAETEENDITENYGNVENDQIFQMVTKKSLSQNEMIANCIIFFLAGYDTTASTLSFASYMLALNPQVQEKAIQELDKALEKNEGDLTYEVVQSLKYLDNVISETLRLFPPAVRLERVADEDYKLGDTGTEVPKGMIVTVPVYAIHRSSEYFPDPEKFDPDRFSPEERAKRNPYAYMPFGAGPRNCVAFRFALMEVKVCLIHILRNFRIERCAETKVPLDYYKGQGLLQPKEIMLKFVERNDTAKIH